MCIRDRTQFGVILPVHPHHEVDQVAQAGHLVPQITVVRRQDVLGKLGHVVLPPRRRPRVGDVEPGGDFGGPQARLRAGLVEAPVAVAAVVQAIVCLLYTSRCV